MVGRPFKPGQSGNPGGRPKMAEEVKALAREHSPWAIKRLVDLAKSKQGPVAVAACKELLDRGIGKAVQPHDGDGDGGPIRIVVQTGIDRSAGA